MKPRQILILIGILALLLAGVFFRQRQKPAQLVTEEYTPLDLSFDANSVGKILIYKGKLGEKKNPDEYVEMTKSKEGQWQISSLWGARADQDKVTSFLEAIRKAKGEQRGKGKQIFKDFGIADEEAFHVSIANLSGKDLLSLALGIKKAGDTPTFIRKSAAETVYLTDANLFGQIGIYSDPAKETAKSDFWASMQIVQFDGTKIQSIETKRFMNNQEIVTTHLSRKETQRWKALREGLPFEIDSGKISQFLNDIKTWRAQKVLDPKAKDYGFAKPKWQMRFELEGGGDILLTSGDIDEKAKLVYLHVSNEPVVFELSRYYFENMDVDDSHFFTDNPLGIDPDKIEKLVIHSDKKEMSFNPKGKKWDSLTQYLENSKNFRPLRLLFDPADQKKVSGKIWIEIQKQGEASKFLEVGEVLSAEPRKNLNGEAMEKEYAASMRGKTQPFAIPESVFKQFFENIDNLAEPKKS